MQDSVTVETLECCSCLDAELKHTGWVKAVGWRRAGRDGEGGGGQVWAGEKRTGFHTAMAGGRLHLFRPSKKNKQKNPQTPHQTKNTVMPASGTPTTLAEEQWA